mmetsp:Transcript_1173/g.4044  ORF Transcript_1173/g.4044 Transcript_1173/m.4044 type:complete len:375 (+) Transcript_1173:1293-2417(+)
MTVHTLLALLQIEESLWMTQKYLGSTHLPFLRVNLEIGEQCNACTLVITREFFWKRLFRQDSETLQKDVELTTVGKSRTSYAHIFQESQIFDLMEHTVSVKILWLLGLIWLDATNIMWATTCERVNQILGLFANLVGCSGGTFACQLFQIFWEERLEKLHLRRLHACNELIVEQILIFRGESVNVVIHTPRVVLDGKVCDTRKQILRIHGRANLLSVILVALVWLHVVSHLTHIIHENHQSRRRFSLNELNNNLVIKVLYRDPFNALTLVLVLLTTQCEINKQLLQLFVDIVDAKLLKRVVFKNFKAIHIQDTNKDSLRVFLGWLHGHIDASNDPIKDTIVEYLCKSVTSLATLAYWLRCLDFVTTHLHHLYSE